MAGDTIYDLGDGHRREVVVDARQNLRHDLIGQVGSDSGNDARNGLLDQVGLEFLDHLLGGGVGRVEGSFTDGVANPPHGRIEGGISHLTRTPGGPAYDSSQPLIGVRWWRHVVRLGPRRRWA